MMSQAAFQALVERSVAARLQQMGFSSPFPLRKSPQFSQPCVSTPPTPTTPRTPQAGETLERSLSVCSNASAGSAASACNVDFNAVEATKAANAAKQAVNAANAAYVANAVNGHGELHTHLFAKSYDDIVPVYRSSKKKLYLEEDKDVVRKPIMELLDPLFLAPLNSTLFRRHAKINEPSTLKKKPDLVFDDFKARIKPTIRTLCQKSRSSQPFLEQRYFWCAYDLVRKRRANHVQKWRVIGRPSNFTYGGKEIYEATYGKINPAPATKKRARRKKKLVSPPPPQDASPPVTPQIHRQASQETSTPVYRRNNCEASDASPLVPPQIIRHSSDDDEDSLATLPYSDGENDDEADAFDPFVHADDSQVDCELRYESRECENCHNRFDFNNVFRPEGDQRLCNLCIRSEKICECEQCGKKLSAQMAFPKTNMDWHDGEIKKSWCGDCYGKRLREQVVPAQNAHMHQQQQKNKKRKRKNSDDKQQQKEIVPCKKCGAQTHKTARSRLCPFNKRYQNLGEENKGAGAHNKKKARCVQGPVKRFGGKSPRYAAPNHRPAATPLATITQPVAVNKAPPRVVAVNSVPPPAVSVNSTPPPAVAVNSEPPSVVAVNSTRSPAVAVNNAPPPAVAVNNAPPPVVTVVAPRIPRVYNLGANVLARFRPRQFYLAHIIARHGFNHDVYFVDDGIVKRNLTPDHLRPCPPSYAAPLRREMIGKTFVYEGDRDIPSGTIWKVRQVVKGTMFRCVKLQGEGELNIDNFDIGFVMRAVRAQYEKEREIGPLKK